MDGHYRTRLQVACHNREPMQHRLCALEHFFSTAGVGLSRVRRFLEKTEIPIIIKMRNSASLCGWFLYRPCGFTSKGFVATDLAGTVSHAATRPDRINRLGRPPCARNERDGRSLGPDHASSASQSCTMLRTPSQGHTHLWAAASYLLESCN